MMVGQKKYVYSFSFWWLVIVAALAILAPVIANKKPLHVTWTHDNNNEVLQSIDATDYRNVYLKDNSAFTAILFAPIPYSAGETDAENLDYNSPFDKNYFTDATGNEKVLPLRFHHFLGTDKRGCDVLAGVIHGARYSIGISIFGMLIATFIALVTGVLAGYFVDEGIRLMRIQLYFLVAGLFFAWFYGFYVFRFGLIDSFQNSAAQFMLKVLLCMIVFATVLLAFYYAGTFFANKFSSKIISIPVDSIISRITETFTSIPSIILLISIVAIAKPSVITIILIFGITSWVDISRMVRAQVMKLKATNFIEATIATGLNKRQVILKHILPNVLPLIAPVVLYGIAMILLAESGLSFLGLGVAGNSVTWGNLLAQGKENIEAWWLIVFPGLFIFLTVNSLYRLGKKV